MHRDCVYCESEEYNQLTDKIIRGWVTRGGTCQTISCV